MADIVLVAKLFIMPSFCKRESWQFFTITNPFFASAFYKWFSLIPEKSKRKILEPFAWTNNIVALIEELSLFEIWFQHFWTCFDIDVSYVNKFPEFPIQQGDSILNYPVWYDVAITNPPYLAKNSATRRNLKYNYPEYEDLYQKCLEVMLNKSLFVAAIIPESFITSWLFTKRLFSVVSLTCKMFDDTDCPVCLAMFVPQSLKKTEFRDEDNFYIYRMDKKLGDAKTLQSRIKKLFCNNIEQFRSFNDKNGEIWIVCIDNSKRATIEFVSWDEISQDRVKSSSRSLTRVSWLPDTIDLRLFLKKCNQKLLEYREISNDIWLTSFKGMRDDGCYRRRLDFKTARAIMNSVLYEMTKK